MFGSDSDSDGGGKAAQHKARPHAQLSVQSRHHAQQQKHRTSMPRGPSLLHQSAAPSSVSQRAPGVGGATTDPGRQQLEASAAGKAHAHPDRAGDLRAESKAERKQEQERGDAHGAETPLGQKLKRGKKRKPASQLQRVQAEVQAKKASPVAAECTADDLQHCIIGRTNLIAFLIVWRPPVHVLCQCVLPQGGSCCEANLPLSRACANAGGRAEGAGGTKDAH